MAKKSINQKAEEILNDLTEEDILLSEEEEQAVTEVKKIEKKVTAKKGPKMYKIHIDEQAGPDAFPEVFVGVNGKHYLIKRGHEVVVPEGVVNVLKETVVTKILVDPKTGAETIKNIPRISFRILGEV